MKPTFTKSCLYGLALAITQASSAGAQTDADSEKATAAAVEQVLVLGEKVERPYLETFTSVGIVTAEDLRNFDIGDTTDAFRRLANVRSVPQAGGNSIQIRVDNDKWQM